MKMKLKMQEGSKEALQLLWAIVSTLVHQVKTLSQTGLVRACDLGLDIKPSSYFNS
jgi:hypothetical protein